jgi:hypothetical protein
MEMSKTFPVFQTKKSHFYFLLEWEDNWEGGSSFLLSNKESARGTVPPDAFFKGIWLFHAL